MDSAMTRYKLSPVCLSRPGWPPSTPMPWCCPGCGSVLITPELQPRCSRCGFKDAG
jgi:hypothetical protein